MTLIQSWMDSLQLLKPKNLQLFAMVTLKSIVEAYKLLFKYFWWLLIAQIMCYKFFSLTAIIIAIVLQKLLFFIVCTITRPSIAKKDLAYFQAQLYPLLYFIVFWLGLIGIGYLFGESMIIPQQIGALPFFAWSIFFTLFFLDSEKTPKSFFLAMWNALKMIAYSLPLVLCVYAFIWIFDVIVLWIIDSIIDLIFHVSAHLGLKWAVPILRFIILMRPIVESLLLPIGICTYANIYIKKLHDQFDLYFKQ